MTAFQEMIVDIWTYLPNQMQMILISFFSEYNVLSDEIKIALIC